MTELWQTIGAAFLCVMVLIWNWDPWTKKSDKEA